MHNQNKTFTHCCLGDVTTRRSWCQTIVYIGYIIPLSISFLTWCLCSL